MFCSTHIIFVLVLFFALLTTPVYAQQNSPIPTHQLHSEQFGSYKGIDSEEGWDQHQRMLADSLLKEAGVVSQSQRKHLSSTRHMENNECNLNKVVFGWNPYWMGTAYETFDFSLLSDVSYFSYEVNPETGNYNTVHSWKTTNLIPLAQAAGTRVNLCVTLFANHALFFNNPTAKQTLIDSLLALVAMRNADGVNIDFEAIPGSQRDNLTTFMRELGERFHAERPGSHISINLPAVDWSKTFDVAAMLPYVDLFIVMGYDYHWRSAPNTGPVAPKNNGKLWSAIDVTRSVNYYLKEGIPPAQLCLALPWYGYDW